MKRRLLNLLTVASALLLVAVVVLLVIGRPQGIDLTLRESPTSVVTTGVEGHGFYLLTISAPRPDWRDAVPGVLYHWTAEFAGFRFGPELPPAHWNGSVDGSGPTGARSGVGAPDCACAAATISAPRRTAAPSAGRQPGRLGDARGPLMNTARTPRRNIAGGASIAREIRCAGSRLAK